MKYRFFLEHPQKQVSTIKVVVEYDGKRYQQSLGKSIPTEFWEQKNQRIANKVANTTYSEATRAVLEMSGILNRIGFAAPKVTSAGHFWGIVECERDGRSYDAVTPETTELRAYLTEVFIPRYKTLKSYRRILRFYALGALLGEFNKLTQKQWKFTEINHNFYREFQGFCIKKQYKSSHYNCLIKQIKQVTKEAMEVDKYHNNADYSKAGAIQEIYDAIYLTEEELERMLDLKIDVEFVHKLYPNSRGAGLLKRVESYNDARDLFLIGAYTGLRVSDFKRLKPENIREDGMITIVAQKTGQLVVAPMHPIVQEILDRGFDLNKESLCEQLIRSYIKVIGRCAGITETMIVRSSHVNSIEVKEVPKYELIGTHTARRSYATNAYKAGVPTLQIMGITGHKKEATFLKYIRVDNEENAAMLAQHPFYQRKRGAI